MATKLTSTKKEQMWQAFRALGQEALKANHYTLSATTVISDPQLWKEFLMETDVNEYIQQETALLQEAEFRSILLNTARDNSAGRAQLINAFMNANNKQQKKEGPIVIYSYVPLNEQQMKAENIEINIKDVFRQ